MDREVILLEKTGGGLMETFSNGLEKRKLDE